MNDERGMMNDERKEPSEWPEVGISDDPELEVALGKIGEIALSGKASNTGYLFYAARARAVLKDFQDAALAQGRREAMELACKAVCYRCADPSDNPVAIFIDGEWRHAPETGMFCEADPIRAALAEKWPERKENLNDKKRGNSQNQGGI